MSFARFLVGDVFAGLATLPDDSVDLIFSSPPFLALRSYLPADHPDKAKEIGSEQTPAEYLDALLDVVEACSRVLAPHGTLCFELGDTYAGGVKGWTEEDRSLAYGLSMERAQGNESPRRGAGWPQDKSLTGIPTLFAWSLAYGRNLLRPERTIEPWRIRNLVPWCRPNPPVGALGDKWRPATSYVTVATKARDRWFDLDAVRDEISERSARQLDPDRRLESRRAGRTGTGSTTRLRRRSDAGPAFVDSGGLSTGRGNGLPNPGGAPPLDFMVLSGEHDDVDVLTLDGWKPITAVVEGDWLATRDELGDLGWERYTVETTATSFVVVATRARDRWFDLDAVRHEHATPPELQRTTRQTFKRAPARINDGGSPDSNGGNPAGAPPLDFMVLPTAPYKGAHYATFPPGLVTPFVRSMCPAHVCRECGQPRRRIVDAVRTVDGMPIEEWRKDPPPARLRTGWAQQSDSPTGDHVYNGMDPDLKIGSARVGRLAETIGWTDCGHGDYRPGVVLDPFAGSGTTLMVATGEGRDAIGIDLDSRNADLTVERLGMFVTVETLEPSDAVA